MRSSFSDVDDCEWWSGGEQPTATRRPVRHWAKCEVWYGLLRACWVHGVWHTRLQAPRMCARIFQRTVLGYQTCLAYLCEHVMLDFLWRLTQWGGGIYSNIDTTHRLMTLLTQFAAERWPRGVDHTEVTINRADCFSFPLLPSRGTHKCLRFSFSTC